MDKHEYMNQIDCVCLRCKDFEIDTDYCKLAISDIIMRAWNDSHLSSGDRGEVLAYTDRIFQEIAERIKQEEKA